MKTELLNFDCLDILKWTPSSSIDSLVTDPPAGISFMGKAWDDDKGGRDAWIEWMREVMTECMRVMKPGAHGLVWALPRTSHWTATALEDAGFEIRDVVTHLFGSGFPKSLDVSKAIDKAAGAEGPILGKNPAFRARQLEHNTKWDTAMRPEHKRGPATDAAKQWQGFGTALKPASEHWILVRKPLSEKTVAKNVLKWGTGALNIDASRIDGAPIKTIIGGKKMTGGGYGSRNSKEKIRIEWENNKGRFPANLVLDEEAAVMLDEQSGFSKTIPHRTKPAGSDGRNGITLQSYKMKSDNLMSHNDSGGASRFFYVAKASKSDKGADNIHPTVKSTKLMSYLIKLVTPPGGTVLDPFMGSGSTGVAAVKEGFQFVGVEREKEYYSIAKNRIGSFL